MRLWRRVQVSGRSSPYRKKDVRASRPGRSLEAIHSPHHAAQEGLKDRVANHL
jgi:hypothetical protein